MAHRSGPDAGQPASGGCHGWPRVVHEVLDELGAVGWPKTSGSKGIHVYVRIETAVRVPRGAPGRVGLRARGGAPGARRRDHRLVAQGPRPDEGVRGLQPECARPHDSRGLLGARHARGDGLGAAALGRDRRRRAGDFTIATMPARFAELGDLHAGIDDAVFDIEPLLEWAERDERELADPGGDTGDTGDDAE